MKFKTTIEELDTKEIVNSKYINWNSFKNSTIMITGATGLIGTQIVNAILYANKTLGTNIEIIALVRNIEKATEIFKEKATEKLTFIIQDISSEILTDKKADFIIHTANGTASKDFVEKPVETINSIVIGTKNILEYAKNSQAKSLVYLSSMEVFGQTVFEKEAPLKEEDYGYIDILKPRSSYPEGKRLAECMCCSYAAEYNLNVKIARLVQTIGAGVNYNDNRVFAQFARNISEKKDIILHTTGESIRSYCYITDAISAIFAILERGSKGECYNVTNINATCSIKEMAEMLCKKYTNSNLVIDLSNENNKYYLPKTKTVLNSNKLNALNWKAVIGLDVMFDKLISNFKNIQQGEKFE